MKHANHPLRPATIRAAIAEWASRDKFSHALTLNTNRMAFGMASTRKLFGAFCYEIDRFKLDRRRMSNVPASDRFHALALPEKPLGKTHLHAVVDLRFATAQGIAQSELEAVIDRIWRKITQDSGSTMLKDIRDCGWGWYISKDFYRNEGRYFLAADFHPH